jgi:hypothetical protein
MPLGRSLAIASTALVPVLVGFWMLQRLHPPDAAATAAPLRTFAQARARNAAITPSAPADHALRVAAPGASAAASLAKRVDAWSRSGDPRQAMQAYDAVFRCLLARRRAHAVDLPPDEPGQDAASLCADLRSDQVQQRLAYLETAARAGEKDAALDFIQEGPSGNGVLEDLDTGNPTPPTADWLARRTDYIERALRNCDLGLAVYLGTNIRQRETRGSPTLQYWLGRLRCPDQPATNTTPLADDPQGQANLDALSINAWQP